jgi:hypothetical protein
LDQSGAFQWFGAVEGANNMSADPIGLSLDADQNLYITGSFRTPADFDPSTGAFPLTNKGLSDGFVAKWAQMTTGMAEPTDAGSDVRFFPNPTQHACQFQFADPGKDVTISLYSPTGLLLKRWFYEEVSSGSIILEELAGWYLIRVDRQNGPSVVQKIIKQ